MKLEDLKFCSDMIREKWIQFQEDRVRYVYLFGNWKGGKEYERAVLESLQFCSKLLCRAIKSQKKFNHLTIPENTIVRNELSESEIEKVMILHLIFLLI